MVKAKVWVLHCGRMHLDRGKFVSPDFLGQKGKDYGKTVDFVAKSIFIDHPDAKIVMDTGFPVDAKKALGWVPHTVTPEDHVLSRLKELGYTPKDIDIVVLSHLDTDHASGSQAFKNNHFLIQKECLRYAQNPYPFLKFDTEYIEGLDLEQIHGDYELVRDVHLIYTPGHVPGHQSLMVKLEHSTVMFTFDACYFKESWTDGILPGVVYDCGGYWESLQKLRHIAKLEKAKVFTSHDPDEYESEIKNKLPFT